MMLLTAVGTANSGILPNFPCIFNTYQHTMSYILPITINNRRVYYLDLVREAGLQEPEPFVAEVRRGRTTLLLLNKEKAAKVLGEEGGMDIIMRTCTFEPSFNGMDGTLQLFIRPGAAVRSTPVMLQEEVTEAHGDFFSDEEDSAPQPQFYAADHTQALGVLPDGTKLFWRESDTQVILEAQTDRVSATIPDQARHIPCTIRLIHEPVHYHADLLLQLVHPLQLLQGALDFGSEASQLIQQRTIERGGHLQEEQKAIDLFEKLKILSGIDYKGKYLQQEEGQPFYKSIFFVKKEMEGIGAFFAEKDFLHQEGDNLRMVLPNDELNNITPYFHQLPNLKLARKHGSSLTNMTFTLKEEGDIDVQKLDELRDKAFGSILRNMIKAWLLPELRRAASPQYIRLTLLVPNIYNEADVSLTLRTLHTILRKVQEERGADKLAGWEVQTISESDAAFLGYYMLHNLRSTPGKYYITIDCGKGTTDFSIIRAGNSATEPLVPVYRNGIAGAGNLISYAIFQALIVYLSNVAEDKEAIRRFVRTYFLDPETRAEPYLLNELAQKIESFKIAYDPSIRSREVNSEWNAVQLENQATFRNLGGREFQTLLSLLSNVKHIPDEEGYIRQVCEAITGSVTANLELITQALKDKGLSCEGVLLTGRGFLFKPLADAMRTSLGGMLGLPQEAIHVPGSPAEYKSISLRGVLNSPFILQPEIIGWPVQVTVQRGTPDPVPAQKKRSFLDYLTSGAWMLRSNAHVAIKTTDALSTLLNDFEYHKLLIGGRFLSPRDPSFRHNNNGSRFDLIFSPEGATGRFLVRRMTPDGHLIAEGELEADKDIAQSGEDYLLPSLFPAAFSATDLEALLERHAKAFTGHPSNH